MRVGESRPAGGVQVTFRRLTFERDPQRFTLVRVFDVENADGEVSTMLRAGQLRPNRRPAGQDGIDAALGADLYVVMNSADPASGWPRCGSSWGRRAVDAGRDADRVVLGGILAAVMQENEHADEPRERESEPDALSSWVQDPVS